jgi:predicted metallo-beta-lactamase superfamily hydrolase
MEENIQHIIELAKKEFIMEDHSIHGFDHWKKLKKCYNVSKSTGVDLTVVRLFAHIHDCKDKMIILTLNTDKDRHSLY